MEVRSHNELLESTEMSTNDIPGPDRAPLNFANLAKKDFAFLHDLGFVEIEASPTIVRYQKGDIEIDVYHGRRSYEIGVELTHGGTRYSLPDLIRVIDPQVAKRYCTLTATTQEAVAEGLMRLGALAKRYCVQALQGNSEFFAELEGKHKLWMEKYWLAMNARQLRPQAHEAFRLGNYQEAAELYKQIQPLLSPTELRKLAIAEEKKVEAKGTRFDFD